MKTNKSVDYLLKNNNDWVSEGYETYKLAREDSQNIMEGRVDSVKQEAQDKMNQHQAQKQGLLHEEELVQNALKELGGEVSIKTAIMNLWIGYALLAACACLWAGHFGFILWTFAPFGLGSKAYLIALGVTITFGIIF